MDLYREILEYFFSECEQKSACSELRTLLDVIVEMRSYQALQKIKAVIEDCDLEDEECFMRIEEIVRIFEQIGSSGGVRHDFG